MASLVVLAADFISARSNTAAASSCETYQQRKLSCDAVHDGDGRLGAKPNIRLTNDPSPDLPRYVAGKAVDGPGRISRELPTIYASHALSCASLNGEDLGLQPAMELGCFGWTFATITVAPTLEVRVNLGGTLTTPDSAPLVQPQPLVSPGSWHVAVTGPSTGTTRRGRATREVGLAATAGVAS